MEGCGVSSDEGCVHLVSVEHFLFCIVGTRCRDDVNVLWCHFYLVCLVFELGFRPYKPLVFIWITFWELVPAAFFYCFVRDKRGRQGEDAWPVKYESIELCCSQRNLSMGFRSPSKASYNSSAKHLSFRSLCTQAYKS